MDSPQASKDAATRRARDVRGAGAPAEEYVPPLVDAFARAICVFSALLFGAGAFFAYSNQAHWAFIAVLAGATTTTLVAGTYGPRSFRIGLLTWLPWF